MSRRRLAGTALVLGALASGGMAAGCGDDEDEPSAPAAAPAAAKAEVAIKGFDFVPGSVTVRAGGTVTWTNGDSAPHNAENSGESGAPASFQTKTPLEQGDSDSVTFSKPGTYTYYCVYHRFMKADVTVK